jgi:drug/metabolite transporter (DMT)-like permease
MASLSWGFADFFGPLKGRVLGALRVLFVSQVAGLLAIALAVAIRGRGPDGGAAILLAIPAAVSGTVGLYAFYRAIAIGAVSVVAPIAGVSAIVPVTVGIATGDRPSAAQLTGIVLVLPGVALAAREHTDGRVKLAAGVPLAILAAIGFGGYFVPMHHAGEADFWWASLVFRGTTLLIVALAVLVARAPVRMSRANLAFVAAVGIGDTLGNVFFAASSQYGLVSVTAVLASLYPLVTIVLAHFVLHERIDRLQQVGIGATLTGVVLISAG